jgi:voltage-gated potassium channel
MEHGEQERRKGPRRSKDSRAQLPNSPVGRRSSDIIDAAAPSTDIPDSSTPTQGGDTFRSKLFNILTVGGDNKASRYFDIFLISLIALNVLAVIVESVHSIQIKYGDQLKTFELFSVLIFSVEYLLRVWTSIEAKGQEHSQPFLSRLRYMLTPMAIIDLLAVAPFYLVFFFSVDLRYMRVLRLLRIFKLTRYSSAMTVVLAVLKKEAQAFSAA